MATIATEYNAEGRVLCKGLGARMHDPVLMRFTSPDPLYADYPSTSSWSHCAATPLNAIDPTGMEWISNISTGEIFWNEATTKDNVPEGFKYIGATDNDLLNYYNLSRINQLKDFKAGTISNYSHTIMNYSITVVTTPVVSDEIKNGSTNIQDGKLLKGFEISINTSSNLSLSDVGVSPGFKVELYANGKEIDKNYTKTPDYPVFTSEGAVPHNSSLFLPVEQATSRNIYVNIEGGWNLSVPEGRLPHSILGIFPNNIDQNIYIKNISNKRVRK